MKGRRGWWRHALVGLALAALVVATAVGAAGPNVNQQVRKANAPDLILYNGLITTLAGENSTVKAIAVRDGKIIATDDQNGRIKSLAGSGTQVVNLSGRRVVPGLVDGHLHGMREGYHCWTQVVRLDLVTSRATALGLYAAKAAELDDGLWIWTTFGGWHLNQLDVPQIFTFAELTAAAPANPVWVTGGGFSGPRVNQAALDALGLAPGDPGVELDAGGQPTGLLTAPATTLANQTILAQLETLGIDGEAACLADFVREANHRGLTAWKDAGGNDAPWGTGGAINDGLHVEEGAMALYRSGGLNARIAFNAMHGYDITRVVPETQNALGFLGDDMFKYLGVGEDVMGTDPLYVDTMRYAAGRRLSVETHVGNIDAILNGFEAANEVYSVGELKWRIAHPGNGAPSDDQLARAQALGIGWALTFPGVRSGAPGPRYRTTMENSAHMCLASDAMNVATWVPFQNLWYVTTGDTMLPGVPGVPADQRLTRLEALRHATVECAWFLDLDGKLGTLEPGMLADLIVLSDDYFKVPDDDIKDLTSLLTVVDGRIVYADGPYAALDD
ncbi:MAG TPA: amidohydrolase family protein [Gaiellaceae bacterium]|nr:amidohydrolase family protein [Gaiellaceae bacterium]